MDSLINNKINGLSSYTYNYINEHKIEYEHIYGIKIYAWFIRKSTIRGLGRKSSDLDVVFLFLGNKKKYSIIFERADRRNEFQLYSVSDAWKLMIENKKRVLSNKGSDLYEVSPMYTHYVFDYFNGIACSIGNRFKYAEESYLSFEKLLTKVYEPLCAAKQLADEAKLIRDRLRVGYEVSLNQMINSIWAGIGATMLLNGSLPGTLDIRSMHPPFISEQEQVQINSMVLKFKQSVQKQCNYGRFGEERMILEKALDEYEKKKKSCLVKIIDTNSMQKQAEEWMKTQIEGIGV